MEDKNSDGLYSKREACHRFLHPVSDRFAYARRTLLHRSHPPELIVFGFLCRCAPVFNVFALWQISQPTIPRLRLDQGSQSSAGSFLAPVVPAAPPLRKDGAGHAWDEHFRPALAGKEGLASFRLAPSAIAACGMGPPLRTRARIIAAAARSTLRCMAICLLRRSSSAALAAAATSMAFTICA
jgi:hypothetical protein